MENLNPKLILPVGISGSGKSTWIKSQTDSNTVVISPDDIRRELFGNVSEQTSGYEVWSIAIDRVINALNAGENVILDATNVKSRERRALLKDLNAIVDRPFDVFVKIFNVDPKVAKQRVRKDIETGVDRSDVPDSEIDKQYQRFRYSLDKFELEGFKIMN